LRMRINIRMLAITSGQWPRSTKYQGSSTTKL
jgi:hypothetical protein